MVDTLVCRSVKAKIEFSQAIEYYQNLTQSVPISAINDWTTMVKKAEDGRQNNISGMDIYAARINMGNEGDEQWPANYCPTAIEEWLDLAFTLEEQQYVYCMSFYFRSDCIVECQYNS